MKHYKGTPGGLPNLFLYEVKDFRGDLEKREIEIGAEQAKELVLEWAKKFEPDDKGWKLTIEEGLEDGSWDVTYTRCEWREEVEPELLECEDD